jgi:hypothetical protein
MKMKVMPRILQHTGQALLGLVEQAVEGHCLVQSSAGVKVTLVPFWLPFPPLFLCEAIWCLHTRSNHVWFYGQTLTCFTVHPLILFRLHWRPRLTAINA